MASRLISSTVILLFLLSSSITSFFAQATSNADFVRYQAERLVKSFNLSPKESVSVNIAEDTLIEPAGFVERKFIFPGLLLSNASVEKLGHHAGYIPIKQSYNARMFYYFFESRGKKSDPVVLWLSGGPGCSSAVALFYENGPFQINDDLSLKWNDFGWDKVSNLLFVDQPIGTGFSYSTDNRDIRHNDIEVGNDLYDFLQAFFKSHPEFVKNDFYITGQSYAGHYIPILASRVHKGNKAKEGIHINLKGFAIGNGFTDPIYQYPAYTDFALANKLIPKSVYYRSQKSIPGCVRSIHQCQIDDRACRHACFRCHGFYEQILYIAAGINHYDIRKKCEGALCYDFSNLEKFFGLDSVKKALGIGNIEFKYVNWAVFNALVIERMKNRAPVIPPLLDNGIRVLIYAGEFDLICNWLGNFKWVNEMKWSGGAKFRKTKLTSYRVAGKTAGKVKSFGPLTFLKVYKAGHMVPMDQPNVSLQMLKDWMSA